MTAADGSKYPPATLDRIFERTAQRGECWVWTGATHSAGYGVMRVNNQLEYVHRLSFELFCADIPEGLTIDHLCKVRPCLRPDHLDPVPLSENIRRASLRSHCRRGHEFTPENSYWRPDGKGKQCRACASTRRAATRGASPAMKKSLIITSVAGEGGSDE